MAGERWTLPGGWVVFGCDSSKSDCPRTRENEAAFGCGGRKGSGPQQLLTMLFHAATSLPWAFRRGPARDSERSHLLEMLNTLPDAAMLLADAGFTGYELLSAIAASGRSFVIRVGANVRLLTKLGYAVHEHEGLVYLWPARQQKRASPLSNVLDEASLSDSAMLDMYRLRWGVELLYRALKQTMQRRKMLSDAPAQARAELDWTVVGLWLLALMNARAAATQQRGSPAAALRVVRRAMTGRSGRVAARLARCIAGDRYTRRGLKAARNWPRKKRERPPGEPQARIATFAEVQLAQEILRRRPAA